MRIQKRVSKDHEELPLPWPKSLLAISPGLLATVGLVNTDFSVWMLVGLILLVAFLVAVYGWNHRTLPGWSLMAVGMLTAIGLVIASGMIGGLASILVGMAANTFVLFTLLVIMITSLGFSKQIQHDPRLIWVLIALVIVCQLAVRIKYFVLLGLSWSVAGQWLDISLYAAVVALLLPVAFGLFLAKRHGRLTMLFVIGMIYANFQILIDVNFKVSDQIGGSIAFVAYKALIPLLFIVIAPLWFCVLAHRSVASADC